MLDRAIQDAGRIEIRKAGATLTVRGRLFEREDSTRDERFGTRGVVDPAANLTC